MSMFSILEISASALTAQSQRMNVTASNLANAESVAGPDGNAYRAKQVIFESVAKNADKLHSLFVDEEEKCPLSQRNRREFYMSCHL